MYGQVHALVPPHVELKTLTPINPRNDKQLNHCDHQHEQACIKLVSRFKRILKRNFRNASFLSLILTRSFHLNVKENQQATKRSLLVEKQKNFSNQKCIDSQPENSLSGDGWC